jgi:murein DD-endopeptidase MepM/ murein hydrolase activator NlpD
MDRDIGLEVYDPPPEPRRASSSDGSAVDTGGEPMTSRRHRLLLALLGATVLTVAVTAPAAAEDAPEPDAKKDPLALAKERLDAAREQATELADKISVGQAEQARLGEEIAAAEREIPLLRDRAEELRLAVKERAVQLYVGRDQRLDALLQTEGVVDGARAAQLTGAIADHDRDLAAELRATAAEIEAKEAKLRIQRADLQRSLDALAPLNAELQKKLALASTAFDKVRSAIDTERGGGDVATGAARCPVDGFVVFRDDFGEPRDEFHTHQGIDLSALEGTPVVAVVPGIVTHDIGGLGGNGAWLVGFDGVAYYYAHFVRYEGDGGLVAAGERIGYVGQTGRATGPHLHFEVHPEQGAAINPYPLLLVLCAEETARAFG